MKLDLFRLQLLENSTPGKLSVDGVFECVTLELPWNGGQNRHDIDCIPPGTYSIAIDYSPVHKGLWPHVLNVPGRGGIRIDVANFPRQLLGCIAVGMRAEPTYIESSQEAWDSLYEKLSAALNAGESVELDIHNPEPEE